MTWVARLCFGAPLVVLGVSAYQLTAGHLAAQRVARAPPAYSTPAIEAARLSSPVETPRGAPRTHSRTGRAILDLTHRTSELEAARLELAASESLTRVEGVAGLASIGTDIVAPELMLAALHDRDARVREEAVHALVGVARDAATPVLGDALHDPDQNVRRTALAELGELDSPDAERLLRATAANSRGPMHAFAAEILAER